MPIKHSPDQIVLWAKENNFRLPMGYRSPKMPVIDFKANRRDDKKFDKRNKFKRR